MVMANANLTGGLITSSDTIYNIPQTSSRVTTDVLTYKYLDILRKYGVLNDESVQAAKKGSGSKVRMPNVNRLGGVGADTNLSLYAQATTMEQGSRDLELQEFAYPLKYLRKIAIEWQRDSLGVLQSMGKYEEEALRVYMQNFMTIGVINQLCGNTATSISAPKISATFTGDSLLRGTGMTAGIAPSTNYVAYGSGASLANPAAITATNAPLVMQDLERAFIFARRAFSNVTQFKTIEKMGCNLLAMISDTGMQQLRNQARAVGADFTLSQMRYSLLEGGKSVNGFEDVTVISDIGLHIVTVPDDLMSRAVNSGTENALSRCALLLGANAIDFAIGAAIPGSDLPAFDISIDDKTNSLDKWITGAAKAIWAAQKVQLRGSGANSGTNYDLSTYVIRHSAAS
jgi:hypothetical protein